MELDFEDFVEEVKFQMIEYENILTKELILLWEERVRKWVAANKNKKSIAYKAKDDIMIKIKNEDVMSDIAQKYYTAVKNNQEDEYWVKFAI